MRKSRRTRCKGRSAKARFGNRFGRLSRRGSRPVRNGYLAQRAAARTSYVEDRQPMASKRDCYEILNVHDATLDVRRSSRRPPIASWPCSTIRTATPGDSRQAAVQAQRRPRKPTKCSRAIPTKRPGSAYDRYGHAGLGKSASCPNFGNAESVIDQFGDLFSGLFGGGGSTRSAARPRSANGRGPGTARSGPRR